MNLNKKFGLQAEDYRSMKLNIMFYFNFEKSYRCHEYEPILLY